MKLHQTIKRIYDNVLKPIFKVEVLSENGWQRVESLNIMSEQPIYDISVTNGGNLKCTGDHILITDDGSELFAKDSVGKTVKTIGGQSIVECVRYTGTNETIYDLTLAANSSHTYFTNGILSHNCVVIDEMAFIPKNIIDEFFASVMPVVSSAKNSKAIIVSTPNGTSGLYYDIWQQANAKEKNKNAEGWKPFRIDWFEVPGRTQEWKEKQIASIGIDRWNQEFGNEFIMSSGVHKLMPDDLLEQYRMKYSEFQKDKTRAGKKQVILSQRGDKAFEFTMWHEFLASHTYLASADIAEGVGGDDSVLYIWDVTDLRDIKMCAMFASNTVSLVEFAYVCSRILGLYGNPFLFAERNGISGGMLDSLNITYGYSSIAVESKNGQPGIYSHISVKEKACIWAREMVTTNGFGYTFYDKDLIEEFGTFVKKENKGIHTVYESPRPAHDDHVMAWIWGQYPLQIELIEKYFIVTETFTSELGQTYPRKLAPLNAYRREDLEKIGKDPLYRDFVEFRESHVGRIKELRAIEQTASRQDIFKYTQDDMYFGGDFDGPSWNAPNAVDNRVRSFNPNNHMPIYFV